MLNSILIKIYNLIFLEDKGEDVPVKHKKTMSSVTIILLLIIVIMICKQIVRNINSL